MARRGHPGHRGEAYRVAPASGSGSGVTSRRLDQGPDWPTPGIRLDAVPDDSIGLAEGCAAVARSWARYGRNEPPDIGQVLPRAESGSVDTRSGAGRHRVPAVSRRGDVLRAHQ